MASQVCASTETTVPESNPPCAAPGNPDAALLLAWANLLSQQFQAPVSAPCVPAHLPVLVDLLGRGVVTSRPASECCDISGPASPSRKRPRDAETGPPSDICASPRSKAMPEGEEDSAVPAKSDVIQPPAVETNSSQGRPISYVTLNADRTHWIISTPVNGGILRHFLPPTKDRLDDILSFHVPAEVHAQNQVPANPCFIYTVSSPKESGQQVKNGIDRASLFYDTNQELVTNAPSRQDDPERTTAAQPAHGHPSSAKAETSLNSEGSHFRPYLQTAPVSQSQTPSASPYSDHVGVSPGENFETALPVQMSHLGIRWNAISHAPGWPAADVVSEKTQLHTLCGHMEAESTDVFHSTSDKGCTTRTCCTEDEFPLDGEKQEATEAYSEMAKKLPKLAGVIFDRVHARWVSTYHDKETRKVMRKYFGVRKHGFEQAYNMAVRHRKLKIMSKHAENDPEAGLLDDVRTDSADVQCAEAPGSLEAAVNKNVCYETLFKTLPRVTGVSYDSYAMKFRAGYMSNGKWNVKDFPIRKYGTFAEAYRRAVSCRLGNSRTECSRNDPAKTVAVAEVSATNA
ncbi:hypothetical protein BESB_045220 [Besnoitia besnoiti]|uniref:Uncharacterized protein n=1 Tax=Besnoitia besnoiti TaxID=94643 RepID=A0A2A9MLJ3_BESBE|nr:hypothetical protein BESB_045220 [Besnoitia besnoiti]PFH36330.1 hypothetical protein BESB_045220 [Besnoitia besnoiti]